MISLDTGLWQRGPSSSFSPLSLSPALWLDASDASTLFQSNGGAAAAADGDPVGYWLDKSGNNYHATQTSGTNKPLLKTAIKNGKNIVRADGTSSKFSIASFPFAMPNSFYIVYKKYSSGSIFESLGNGSTYLYESWSNNWLYAWSKPSGVTGNNIYSNVVDDYSGFCLFDESCNSTTATIFRNNASVSFPNSQTGTYLSTFTSLLYGDGAYAKGDIAEFLYFNSAHDSATKATMRSYLNSKWAIY